jgi:protein TonB
MRTHTLALSIVVHMLVLAALVVVPIVAYDSLPDPRRALGFVQEVLPVTSVPAPRSRSIMRARAREHRTQPAPVEPPAGIAPEPPTEAPRSADPDGVAGGDREGVRGSIFTDPEPPPPPPTPTQPVKPLRVGGAIREPRKIHHVAPVYPPIAVAARKEGIVILEAEIGEDGRVRNLRVLRSTQLLDQAAVDAVRQWTFTPTLLNGVPVPVVMTVTVAFTLQR